MTWHRLIATAHCILLLLVVNRSNAMEPVDTPASATLRQATQLADSGNFRGAERALLPILEPGTDRPTLWNARELYLAILCESGRFTETVTFGNEFLTRLARETDGIPIEKLRRSATVSLSRAHTKLGDHEAAVASLQAALNSDTKSRLEDPLWEIQALCELGEFSQRLPHLKLSERHWEDVIERCVEQETLILSESIRLHDLPEVAESHARAMLATDRESELGPLVETLAEKAVLAAVRVLQTWAATCHESQDVSQQLEHVNHALELLENEHESDETNEPRLLARAELLWARANASQPDDMPADESALRDVIAAYTAFLEVTESSSMRIGGLQRIFAAYKTLDEKDLAIDAGTKVLDLLTETAHSLDPRTHQVSTLLGTLCYQQDRHLEAMKYWQSALTYWSDRVPADANAYTTCLMGIANLYIDKGDTSEAMKLLRVHDEHCRTILQEDAPILASVLSSRGSLESAHGYFQNAIICYSDAERLLLEQVSIREEHYRQLAEVRFDSATIHQAQASHQAAEILYRQAMEDLLKIESNHSPKLSRYHVALATESLQLAMLTPQSPAEMLEKSRRYCDSAERLIELNQQHETPLAAKLADVAGDLARIEGNVAVAREKWQRGIKVARSTNQLVLTARILNKLAALETTQHRTQAAGELMEEAVAIIEGLRGFPNLRYVTLVNYARVLLASAGSGNLQEDRFAEIQALLEQAIELIEEPRKNVRGNATDRAQYFQNFGDAFTLLFGLHSRRFNNRHDRDSMVEAIFFAEAGRNRTFLDQVHAAGLQMTEILASSDASLIEKRETLLNESAEITAGLRANSVFSELAYREPDATEPGATDPLSMEERIDEIDAQLLSLEQEIYDRIESSSAQTSTILFKPDRGSWNRQLNEILKPGLGVLIYHIGRNEGYLAALTQDAASCVSLMVPSDGRTSGLGIPSGPLSRGDVAHLTSKYLQTLKNQRRAAILASEVSTGSSITTQKDESPLPGAVAIGEILLPEPIREFIRNQSIEQLIVIPDAALHQLPFEGLVISDQGNPRFILDAFPPIAYSPSIMVMARLMSTANGPDLSNRAALTVGNPTRTDVVALPEAEAESNAIYDIWAEQFGAENTFQLVDSEATESAVSEFIHSRPLRFVHFAVHGKVAHEQGGSLVGGLLLAAANDQAPSDSDAQLTLSEVHSLPLRYCELAVLSACETNVGFEVPLEAGMTMARSFFAAGTQRVIASQWKVSDASTSQLMVNLFKELSDASSNAYAIALHNARKSVREEWPSPYHWASFVLIGPPQ